MRRPPARLATVLLVLVSLAGCVSGVPSGSPVMSAIEDARPVPGDASDAAFVDEIDAWHEARIERLRADDGWLTLVGLAWLAEGDNAVGRGPDHAVRHDGFPARDLGVITVAGDDLRFRPAPGARVEGLPADGRLATDADGAPTIVTAGTCRFHVIARGDRLGVRIKDSAAPLRASFGGVGRFPVDAAWRIEAPFEPLAPGATVPVELIIGTRSDETIAGRAVFTHAGTPTSLLLMPTSDADRYFVVFGDTTNGDATYGGGRFLEARRTPAGTVVLDFNRAYNPPCSFTPYATCPLPPAENRLAFAVTAGERVWGGGTEGEGTEGRRD